MSKGLPEETNFAKRDEAAQVASEPDETKNSEASQSSEDVAGVEDGGSKI